MSSFKKTCLEEILYSTCAQIVRKPVQAVEAKKMGSELENLFKYHTPIALTLTRLLQS